MPRYYFHLHAESDRLQDEEGLVLPDAEAAWFQAVRSGREVLRADALLGFGCRDQRIEIADESGSPLDLIPLQEIARYAM